jgi:hypothetical protein
VVQLFHLLQVTTNLETTRSLRLRSLTSDTTGQLDILGHDSDTLGVNGTQVGIFKESNEVGFGRLLKGQHGRSLETQIGFEILSNLTNQTLEGQLANQKIRRLLVPTNLTKSNSSGTVTMGLLDTSSGRSRFTCGLGGKLLTRSLASGGFTSGLENKVTRVSEVRVSG